VANRGFFTRFVARGTSSALDRIPIRWRLAGGSALLTLVILCGFAVAVGALTAQRIEDDFKQKVRDAADNLRDDLKVTAIDVDRLKIRLGTNLQTFVSGEDAAIRVIVARTGEVLRYTKPLTDLGPPVPETNEYRGWRVENRIVSLADYGLEPLVIQYGRPKADVEATIRRVKM